VLLLVLVLENSRYLAVTLIKGNSAGIFVPCFDAGSQQIEHEHDDEHEHDSLTSEFRFSLSIARLCMDEKKYMVGNWKLARD
jgi:hypothetical protein